MAEKITGVLKITRNGAGMLRDPARSFRRGPRDALVPPRFIKRLELAEGATITGPIRQNKKGLQLTEIESVCGLPLDQFRRRRRFESLTPITPDERFRLDKTDNPSMRIIDMVAPIGKGTRGLIVSPAKAGKTTILEQIANAVRANHPETRVVVLLVDERPEEVTHFRRAVDAQVLASSIDQELRDHIELCELTLAHIRVELECGRDVLILVDSLTRMARAFNSFAPSTDRTLSGGVTDGALKVPRSFFGLARNIEDGGSITMIGTVLVDTGSRMDQLIFHEFKGTGNSEIVLDRQIAEARVFPAINLNQTGTRKEERLYSVADGRRIALLRKAIASRKPMEAIGMMLQLIEKYPTNEDFLRDDLGLR